MGLCEEEEEEEDDGTGIGGTHWQTYEGRGGPREARGDGKRADVHKLAPLHHLFFHSCLLRPPLAAAVRTTGRQFWDVLFVRFFLAAFLYFFYLLLRCCRPACCSCIAPFEGEGSVYAITERG